MIRLIHNILDRVLGIQHHIPETRQHITLHILIPLNKIRKCLQLPSLLLKKICILKKIQLNVLKIYNPDRITPRLRKRLLNLNQTVYKILLVLHNEPVIFGLPRLSYSNRLQLSWGQNLFEDFLLVNVVGDVLIEFL